MDQARVTSHVRMATYKDLKAIFEHDGRHTLESGRDGDVIFLPFEAGKDQRTLDEFADPKFEAFEKPVTEKGWERAWIITDEKQVYGVLWLVHSPKLEASLHRCLLMMGIERSHRRGGFGSKLISEAIDWAKSQKLSWIQLNVFDHNEPAKALYRKFGFQEIGTSPDLFRVHGQSINDTEMVLRLD